MPDLIITDVMMPRLDGYDLSRLLRDDARTSRIPIVMLTARAAREDKLEGLQTGVDTYLEKPLSPKELLARVNNLIASRERLALFRGLQEAVRAVAFRELSLNVGFRPGGAVCRVLERACAAGTGLTEGLAPRAIRQPLDLYNVAGETPKVGRAGLGVVPVNHSLRDRKCCMWARCPLKFPIRSSPS